MRRAVQTHQDLIVWQRSLELAIETYRISRLLPKDERFGLVAQMRRAATSIAANIAEGSARGTRREMRYFLVVSRGSLRELETYHSIIQSLGYVTAVDLEKSRALGVEVGKMLNALRKRLAS